ncbi:alpha/beta hydrolase fold-domain-containing protein [Syncephalastrum racemosum]|uniref:Alpha/beta hydrolase fold-domain-containing protein n=1 Tax=Syncephalastrum racemosum TaxID=13706 RepID=A0A1X2HJG0_SYNRA|nr:alpha/beta hydrolase fold-domain-containing protein [Syncephalastrum racemosum]
MVDPTGRDPVPEVVCKEFAVKTEKYDTIPIFVIRPPGTEDEVLPALIYTHGGGYVFGNKLAYEKLTAEIAVKAHIAVIHVEYTLIPEAQYPRPLEESYDALKWVHENGKELLRIDPARIGIAGDSAGGNLCAGLTLLTKQRGHVDWIQSQVLIYPYLASDEQRLAFESVKLYGDGSYGAGLIHITMSDGALFPQGKITDSITAPLTATREELTGLPPTLVITCEYDMLRDEAEEYVSKLIEAGGDATALRVNNTLHAYLAVPVADTPAYHTSIAAIAGHLQRTL